MSRNYVEKLERSFNRGQDMMDKFLTDCPEDLWQSVAGGYPVWLQYYHLMACVETLVMALNEPPKHQLYDMDTLFMCKFPEQPLSKAKLTDYNNTLKAYFADYMKGMDDAKLLLPHEGASQRLNKPMTHMDVVEMIIAHVFYHLGSFDANLRDRGLKGLYGV